ncbi:MAG: hypothetical protein IBJ13_01130 [Sphingopyxis sp.]|nr:hypothetical protein [Sphingopyxis sp.]
MIEIREQPEIRSDPSGGWQIIFWVLNAFDYTTPFRAILSEIAQALGQDPQNDLRLPPFEAGEDFIEGILQFGTATLSIYYEHSLSYLSLTNDDENVLREVADRVQQHIHITRR